MIAPRAGLRVWMATRPVDFRKGVHGLVALVADVMCADPYGGDVFVFRSKRNDRVKLLAWDGSGIVLATKWLENGRFVWPPVQDGAMSLSASQLALLLDGLSWSHAVAAPVRRPVWPSGTRNPSGTTAATLV
ncbi:IS66 family insertion sequence element accessory protein TnpB [Rhodovastum atsumiense]|nr:IS66 family insertion sequence element accessory protein TnpB [Rhodovastum atsumiense]CAH2603507.1 IS66 family insertion sequence element accessory protein TnpB [Rhodovastum atsumiense]